MESLFGDTELVSEEKGGEGRGEGDMERKCKGRDPKGHYVAPSIPFPMAPPPSSPSSCGSRPTASLLVLRLLLH